MSDNNNKNYSFEVQSVLLDFMISDTAAFTRCQNIIKPEYFHDRLKPAVRYILNFADEYRALPKVEQVVASTGVNVNLVDNILPQHSEWFLTEIESFCKHRATELVMFDGAELIQEGKYSEVEARLKEALTISLQTDLGTDYFADPKARIQAVLDRQDVVSTGWSVIDSKLYGGFTKGTLNIFAGGSGCVIAGTKVRVKVQKTGVVFDANIEDLYPVNNGELFLADSPDGWVPIEQWRNKGIKEVYTVVMEDGVDITASHDHLFQKSDNSWVYTRDLKVGDSLITTNGFMNIASLTKVGEETVYDLAIGHDEHRYFTNGICSHNSGKSIFLQNLAVNWANMGLDVVYFSLELSENLVSARLDSMVTGYSTKDVFKKIDDVDLRVRMAAKKAGSIRVKKLPEAGTSTNDLRAYLKEYEIKLGKKPEVMLVDYLDLMYPNNKKINPSDMFVKDKFVAEELRALYSEYNLLGASASQLNRCLSLDTKVVVNGTEKEIKDVNVGDWLESENGPVRVTEVLPITKQSVFEITTKSGKKIKVSAKHKFPTKDGDLKTIETGLKVGDFLRSRDK